MKMTTNIKGFSAIEMMVVMAVMVILAMAAIPSSFGRIVKEQVKVTTEWSEVATAPVGIVWATTGELPVDNDDAGLPDARKIVSNFVSKLEVVDGAVHITFGNKANSKLKDKVLTMRPAVIPDSPMVPIAWVCGHSAAPSPMEIKGSNKTDIPNEYLPLKCRARKQ